MGIGESLTRHIMDAGRTRHYECIWLWVDESNAAATTLYRRLGFVASDDPNQVARVGRDPRRPGVRRLIMRAPL